MRVKKTIKGYLYNFYVQFIPREKKAEVRYFRSDAWTICELSEDFNYILLPQDKFIFNGVSLKKLKLNRAQSFEAKEYNGL